MRTDNPAIFAVGDCAEKYSFVTRTLKGTMLASTSCAEAGIAGMNLYKLSTAYPLIKAAEAIARERKLFIEQASPPARSKAI